MNQRNDRAIYNRIEVRSVIMKHFSPEVNGQKLTYLTTTEIKDELNVDCSLRFVGQQLDILRFQKKSVKFSGVSKKVWVVVRLNCIITH